MGLFLAISVVLLYMTQSVQSMCSRASDPSYCDMDVIFIEELSGNGAHFLDDLKSNIVEMASAVGAFYQRAARFSLWGYKSTGEVEPYGMLTDLKGDGALKGIVRMTNLLVSAERAYKSQPLDDSPDYTMPTFEAFRRVVTDSRLGMPLIQDPDDRNLRIVIMTSSGYDPRATDSELEEVGRFLTDHQIHLYVCRHEHVRGHYEHYKKVLPKNYFSHGTCKYGQIGRPGAKTLISAVKDGARDLFYDDTFWQSTTTTTTAVITTTRTGGTFPPFTFPINPTWPTDWPTLPPYPSTTKTTTSTASSSTSTASTDPWTLAPPTLTSTTSPSQGKEGTPIVAPLAGAFGGIALLAGASLGAMYVIRRRRESAGAEEIDEEAWESEIDHFVEETDHERSASIAHDEYTDF